MATRSRQNCAPPPAAPARVDAAPAIPASVVARLGPVVLRTFSEEDFHRVDMRSIAREAGMSFATIYRYFRDKEALLFWFISHWVEDLYAGALATLNTGESALARLQNYLLAHLEFYERNPEVGRIIFVTVPLARWMRDETYGAREPVRRIFEVIAEGQAAGQIRADLSKVLVFDAWSGVFNRAFLMWEYRQRSYSLTGEWRALSSILADGIAGRPTRARPSRSRS